MWVGGSPASGCVEAFGLVTTMACAHIGHLRARGPYSIHSGRPRRPKSPLLRPSRGRFSANEQTGHLTSTALPRGGSAPRRRWQSWRHMAPREAMCRQDSNGQSGRRGRAGPAEYPRHLGDRLTSMALPGSARAGVGAGSGPGPAGGDRGRLVAWERPERPRSSWTPRRFPTNPGAVVTVDAAPHYTPTSTVNGGPCRSCGRGRGSGGRGFDEPPAAAPTAHPRGAGRRGLRLLVRR